MREVREHRLRAGERAGSLGELCVRAVHAPLERATLEVVPEAPEAGTLALERRDLRGHLIVQGLRGVQLLLGRLALRELRTVVLRQVHAALALVLLAREVGDELGEQLAPGLPET